MEGPLAKNEAELLKILTALPYAKRTGYALRMVNNHREDPAILTLIDQLLSTTPLPDTVPFPGEGGSIKLLYPQSTASKRFFQREIGLAMASALGSAGIPFLLAAIAHPSTAGKPRAIQGCANGASDGQIIDIYQKLVPATQEMLRTALSTAGRVDVLKALKLWKEPPPADAVDPVCVVLERELKDAKEQDRESIWARAGFSAFRIHRRQRNPQYIPADSEADLVTTLFGLLEKYPAVSTRSGSSYNQIPPTLHRRLFSFLQCDLARTLRLVRATCHVPDPGNKGQDKLKIPAGFMHQKASYHFWHHLSLEDQLAHLQPFILDLMNVNDHVFLKNRQLASADLLKHARSQVIVNVADAALACLQDAETVRKLPEDHRDNIAHFIVYTIETLVKRFHTVAHIERKSASQTAMEAALQQLIRRAAERFLTASRVSATSDSVFVENFVDEFSTRVVKAVAKYPPLVQTLFDSVKGIFDVAQVSKAQLLLPATQFLTRLKTKTPSVFDIPDDGVVQPYCGIKSTDNEAALATFLRLFPPRENLRKYPDILHSLSPKQRDIIWSHYDDAAFVGSLVFSDSSSKTIFEILRDFPPSPSARQHIVVSLLDDKRVTETIEDDLFPLLDITHAPSRALLHKNTYKRVFDERYTAYGNLMQATWASGSVKEYLATMRFMIPRIKNEIAPDALGIPNILDKGKYVSNVEDVIRLVDGATVAEAKEVAELFLGWEKQNNEAVTRVSTISSYIRARAIAALAHFADRPSHPFFRFGMELLWIREVFENGPLKAPKTYQILVPTSISLYTLTEAEELTRRRFVQVTKDKNVSLGWRGFWRVSDERALVESLLAQYHKVHQHTAFEDTSNYQSFLQSMTGLLQTRWTAVPVLVDAAQAAVAHLQKIEGSNVAPADWQNKEAKFPITFLEALRSHYYDEKITPGVLPWWDEFRRLRLLSTHAGVEVKAMREECKDRKTGKTDRAKLDALVEKLLAVHDSAVHLPFVRTHVEEMRQDLLKECHITDDLVGVFNQLGEDVVPQPAEWQFRYPRRLAPSQCEFVAVKLRERMHSGEVSLELQVKAAEQLTRLPTTTIIELSEILKEEDLNARITEAVLMHLPHLDEPAACIQFLLAPTYLDGDLSRTVVFSIRNALQHVHAAAVPGILVPVFPPADSKRKLKIMVFKECVRLVCQYLYLEEHRRLLAALWKRKMHQDVRIALLQSMTQTFGTDQEDFAWSILQDAISDSKLLLDDTLLGLLAVKVAKPVLENSDLSTSSSYIEVPPALDEMAKSEIPAASQERYTKEILFRLMELPVDAVDSLENVDSKELKLAHERIEALQRAAYMTILGGFLTPENARTFATRVLATLKASAFVESDTTAQDMFLPLAYALGRSVALDPACWGDLLQLVDFLAAAVGSSREPTSKSRVALKRLRSMKLETNFTFQRPDKVKEQLVVDRMSLVEPFAKYGCDHFQYIAWQRKLHLFKCEREHGSAHPSPTEKAVANELLRELAGLCAELQMDMEEFKRQILAVHATPAAVVRFELTEDIFSGKHGLSETPWLNEVRLALLTDFPRMFNAYPKSLSTFQAQLAADPSSFYALNSTKISSLIVKLLQAEKVNTADIHTVLDTVIARAESSPVDAKLLEELLGRVPSEMIRHLPDWSLVKIYNNIMAVASWDRPGVGALEIVRFVNKETVDANRTSQGHAHDISPITVLLVESIFRGDLLNFNLGSIASSLTNHIHLPLTYPYLIASGDASGGDIEERKSKMSIEQLTSRYETWRAAHGNSYLSGPHPSQMPPNATWFMHHVLEEFPQLLLVNPALFLSWASLRFAHSDLSTKDKMDWILKPIQKALTPQRNEESGTRWDWAPPLSLALSFARSLLTETADEVAEAVMEDSNVGYVTCKLAGVRLLQWWETLFFTGPFSHSSLVLSMIQDEPALMDVYDELRRLACQDSSRVIREAAFELLSSEELDTAQTQRRGRSGSVSDYDMEEDDEFDSYTDSDVDMDVVSPEPKWIPRVHRI